MPDNEESRGTSGAGTPSPTPQSQVVNQTSTGEGVANPEDNAKLTHSDKDAPLSTRQDLTDVGVPMQAGSPGEPVGPEDVLGEGQKRGDYRSRLGGREYQPHTTVRIEDAEQGEPHTKVVDQRSNADDIGDDSGKKGGVTTTP